MRSFLSDANRFTQFVCYSETGQPVGFVEASVRHDYVNGTSTSPVAFLEGIYVIPAADALDSAERPALIAATRGAMLFAPSSLPWEVDNTLLAATRRRRLTAAAARRAWTSYERVPLRLVDIRIPRAVDLAIELGLYAYDGYMLELARQRGLPLLTLDRKLAAAATTSSLLR